MDSVGGIVKKVDLEPRMHMIADLSSDKFNLHLSHFIVELYEFPRFSARRCANLLYTMEALLPAENTSGEKGHVPLAAPALHTPSSSPTHSFCSTGLRRSCDSKVCMG